MCHNEGKNNGMRPDYYSGSAIGGKWVYFARGKSRETVVHILYLVHPPSRMLFAEWNESRKALTNSGAFSAKWYRCKRWPRQRHSHESAIAPPSSAKTFAVMSKNPISVIRRCWADYICGNGADERKNDLFKPWKIYAWGYWQLLGYSGNPYKTTRQKACSNGAGTVTSHCAARETVNYD